jgi:hypothetical protein
VALFCALTVTQSVILGLNPRTHAEKRTSLEMFKGSVSNEEWTPATIFGFGGENDEEWD